ncbi:hypothetical protein [Enterobacter sp. 262D3]|uniref:hypothetical protein n=1 Tax=Enterobacter sp. 262D3 TaxID=3077763 RepID=UPI002A8399CB|nr:hypothetical protein [Enterobacter sp. 262D3]
MGDGHPWLHGLPDNGNFFLRSLTLAELLPQLYIDLRTSGTKQGASLSLKIQLRTSEFLRYIYDDVSFMLSWFFIQFSGWKAETHFLSFSLPASYFHFILIT